jgi:molybdopterin-guanine dinucleotide biosynthesis protein MobB
MKRLHIVGRKNSGKTTLVVDLVQEFARRGVIVGTIKHTHHRHELDVPGKDSYQHRTAGAAVVGILSPAMNAIFIPTSEVRPAERDRYEMFAPMFAECQLVLVEGDSQTPAPKIEVWRNNSGAPPMAASDPLIAAIVTDDQVPFAYQVLSRSDVANLADWIISKLLGKPILY